MPIPDALADLNNAVLDIQSADYNTISRPLKKMAKALADPELKAINDELTSGLDFDAFLQRQEHHSGIGRDELEWPTDKNEELGLTILLIERAAANTDWFVNFAFQFYDAGSKIIGAVRNVTRSAFIPFLRDYKAHVEAKSAKPRGPQARKAGDVTKVFIVHGHEEAPREMVARFLEKLGLQAIILHEQTNRGMTVAEKLEANNDVGFAVVIMTPDDFGRSKTVDGESPRARQNVILELGYFIGHLGRDKVCALKQGDLEIPSDFVGVVYTAFDQGGAWRLALAKELDAAGYHIDFNAVMRG